MECSLLISSCDSYKDILDSFFKTLNLFWRNIEYKIYLSTESLDYKNEYFDITNLHPSNKNCTWTERISDALKKIDSKYIIFLLDDFFLYDVVNEEAIKECINYMEKNKNIATFTFYPIFGLNDYCIYDNFLKVNKKNAYIVTSAVAGIWSKSKLLKYTDGYKENIWQWEKNSTIRSKIVWNKDEFYVTKNIENNIIPYDFTRYGLFSGSWLSDTKKLFSDLNIKFDYTKRGFYNPEFRGTKQSIIDSFLMDSAVIPNFSLNHKGSSLIKFKGNLKLKKFNQSYNIKKAKNIILWEPSSQWGFGITNLKIKIKYLDKSYEILDNKLLFGSFRMVEEIFVFNSPVPSMYIPAKENKKISKLYISGELIMPLDKKLLKKAYLFETKSKIKLHNQWKNDISLECLVSKEKRATIIRNSSVSFYNNKIIQDNTKIYSKNNKNEFIQKIMVPKDATLAKYQFSNQLGYGIKNLKIKLLDRKGKSQIIPSSKINGLSKIINNTYIFLSSTPLEINLNDDTQFIIISGTVENPINSKILKKFLESNGG